MPVFKCFIFSLVGMSRFSAFAFLLAAYRAAAQSDINRVAVATFAFPGLHKAVGEASLLRARTLQCIIVGYSGNLSTAHSVS